MLDRPDAGEDSCIIPADDIRDCLDGFAPWSRTKLTLPENTHAVSLVAKNEEELAQIEQKLIENKIQYVAIREPDLNNQLMAIGVVPCQRTLVKRLLQGYPLSGSSL